MIIFFILFEITRIVSCRLLLVLSFINNGNQANKTYFSKPTSFLALNRNLLYVGSNIRTKYIQDQKFLSPSFNHSELLIMSSDYNRTIENGYLILSGVYPLKTGPTLKKNFPLERALPPFDNLTVEDKLGFDSLPNKYQAVPIHNTNLKEDFIFNSYALCPEIENLIKNEKAKKDYIYYHEKARRKGIDLMVRHNISFNSTIMEDFEDFVDTESRSPYDLALKPILNNFTTLREMVKLVSDHTNPLQNMLILTNWVSHALEVIDRVVRNHEVNKLKYVLYLGEEQMMFAFVSILNISHPDCLLNLWEKENKDFLNCEHEFSKIGSQISIEIHQKENETDRENLFTVRMLYNGKIMNLFKMNSNESKLFEFQEYLKSFLVKDFKKSCHYQEESIKTSNSNYIKNKKLQEAENEMEANYEFITALIILETLLIIVVSVLIYFRKQNVL